MIINCKYCKNKFAIDAEDVGYDGRLVKCSTCNKEWFQESKAQILEKKLIELDRNLHATELHLVEKKSSHNNKIRKLEKSLKTKKEELEKQKQLEERIHLFEKRIKDTERQIESQSLVENRISKLEKEIKKNSFDSFVKNTYLEKKTNELQDKIHSEDLQDKLEDLEKLQKEVENKTIEVTDNEINLEKKASELEKKISSYNENSELGELKKKDSNVSVEKNIINNEEKRSRFNFWSDSKKKEDAPAPDTGELVKEYFKKKNFSDEKIKINNLYKTKNWDLSQKTLDHELKNVKKNENKS